MQIETLILIIMNLFFHLLTCKGHGRKHTDFLKRHAQIASGCGDDDAQPEDVNPHRRHHDEACEQEADIVPAIALKMERNFVTTTT